MELIGCQYDILWEAKEENQDRVLRLLERAGPTPGSLVVLPEMFNTGFSMAVERMAEERGGPTSAFLSRTAQRFQIHLLAGVMRKTKEGKGANEAAWFGPDGKERLTFRKLHPFSYAGETRYFTPGEEIALFAWDSFLAAPFICYDLRFPEAFRMAVDRGAQIFLVIASWPAVRHEHWTVLLRARAIENQAYLIGVNRCGTDPCHAYAGGSLILGPRGEILADAGEGEAVIRTSLDANALAAYRAAFPALPDRRFTVGPALPPQEKPNHPQ